MVKVRLQGHLGRVPGELLRLRFAILVATWGARGPDAGPKIKLLVWPKTCIVEVEKASRGSPFDKASKSMRVLKRRYVRF